ncbi:6-phosphogluconate phosphatase [Lachnellula suecica]|uniref:6-phosphogluconate phosphatase n=1 Tax=Lachnellula suecica TaxID=602035 RepID=A0A8T9C6S4_9HELO|nr:6-phosphogluconate phosphatase [Lachnellula suecica]
MLFDCDNTLVLSECLAFEACADLVNEILASRNIKDRFTGPQLQQDFVGQSFQNMMSSLKTNYKYEYYMSEGELNDYANLEDDRVIQKLEQKLKPCVGVKEELARLVTAGEYHMSIVSGSSLQRIYTSIKSTSLDRYFSKEEVFSAADSLHPSISKPDPAVYLHSLMALGKSPEECVAIEDSRSGAMAATRAGIKVIGYVGCYEIGEQDRMREVLVQAGCFVIMDHWKNFEICLGRIQHGDV